MRTISTLIAPIAFALLVPTPAAAQDRPFRPVSAGGEARHDGWDSDGAPRPPRMWRGHGATRWTDHYHACRKAYGNRYDHRTDTVGGRNRRCAL